jgi:hypothetical protein
MHQLSLETSNKSLKEKLRNAGSYSLDREFDSGFQKHLGNRIKHLGVFRRNFQAVG